MNKGKTWKLLAISWRLFPFLLMQVNTFFAWMRVGIPFFFQKCCGCLIFLLREGSRQTLQSFSISWPERTEIWSLVWAAKAICLGLFSEEAWGRHPTTTGEKEGVLSVSIGTRLLLRQLFLKFLLTCVANYILGKENAGPQHPCVCMCCYIRLSRTAGYLKQSC